MQTRRIVILIWGIILGISNLYAKETCSEFYINFRVDETHFDAAYGNNHRHLQQLTALLEQLQSDNSVSLLDVTFCGSTSPEGSHQHNLKLSRERLSTLEAIVRRHINLPDSIITREESYIPWTWLTTQVEKSDIPYKQQILEVLTGPHNIVRYHGDCTIDSRVLDLKKIARGKAWRELQKRYFRQMRNACAILITYKHIQLPTLEVEAPTMTMQEMSMPALAPVPQPLPEVWNRQLYIKTNALYLPMLLANAAVEVDLCPHLSFTLPIYYSALNYFTDDIKFRFFGLQPEFRYWFNAKPSNDGWFIGAHFSLLYYNIAVNGEYRYQDHGGYSPSVGGGIAGGYRLPIDKNERWHIEFSLGAGAYTLYYDKFRNEPNGKLVGTEKSTYIGLDQVAVSFSYRFHIGSKQKGGKR